MREQWLRLPERNPHLNKKMAIKRLERLRIESFLKIGERGTHLMRVLNRCRIWIDHHLLLFFWYVMISLVYPEKTPQSRSFPGGSLSNIIKNQPISLRMLPGSWFAWLSIAVETWVSVWYFATVLDSRAISISRTLVSAARTLSS